MSLACLPWYDLAETQAATDRLWAAIAAQLREQGLQDIPKRLDRRADYESQWKEPDLLLGQACGYDVYCANDHDLQIVGVPLYGMRGCEGSKYRSFVIVRADSNIQSLAELRGARCVINSPRSHSGMNVLQALVAPLATAGNFFSEVQVSGAHERSLDMIAAGSADVAAIDCITYGLLHRHRPAALVPTRIVDNTPALTAPPYVTSPNTDSKLIPILRGAIETAITALSDADREDLGLLGVQAASLADYKEIAALERAAHSANYRELVDS